MALAFFDTQTGNPAKLKMRAAGQATLGQLATANFRDFRAFGAPFGPEKATVERLVLSTNAAPGSPLPGKAIVGTRTLNFGDIDPADRGLLQVLANIFAAYGVTDNTTWQEWIFSLDAALSPTTPPLYLSWLLDNDVIPRMTYFDTQISAVEVTAEVEGNLIIAVDVLVGQYQFLGDGTQTTGSSSTIPVLTGTYDGTWETTDEDIFVKIVSVSGQDITIQAKLGTAASYAGAAIAYTMGDDPVRLVDETGARIGAIREQVRFFIPASSTLVVLDEFEFVQRRAAWTATLATERPIAAVNTEFLIDTARTRTEGGWSFRLEYANAEVRPDVAEEQRGTPSRRGVLNATVTIAREIAELSVQKALDRRAPVALVLNALTDAEISTSGREYRLAAVFPACTPGGELFGVDDGGENRDEEVTFTCGVPASGLAYDGNTYASHAHILIENDVTAL